MITTDDLQLRFSKVAARKLITALRQRSLAPKEHHKLVMFVLILPSVHLSFRIFPKIHCFPGNIQTLFAKTRPQQRTSVSEFRKQKA